ncbi:uroporphyrinogen-III synthase [Oceaniradius stylonematis]|uniref:Uroporphyrinogen-III synthase n=1 Tax=Oceaniradius stylonematis TaxID=2184161 RepID=A0A3A8AID8_9HYPH|nr:uroporphyrinogen-III synthase [Oceaniradius stylonematis]RKF07460.1 uroporphyrinogen-III synthase [Oceaniradius stylonematis]
MTGRRPRVLVTRPEPGASRTAAALGEAGIEAIICPFTESVDLPVKDATIAEAGRSAAAAVTSAKAIIHAPPALVDAVRAMPVFAVGDATARAAREAGMVDVRSADGDAIALAGLVGHAIPADAPVAYLCGRVRTGELERRLSETGRKVTLIETYTIQKVSHLTDKITNALKSADLEGMLLHSGMSARLLADALEATGRQQLLENTTLFLISERAGEPLERLAQASIVAAPAPRDDALVETVRRHFSS